MTPSDELRDVNQRLERLRKVMGPLIKRRHVLLRITGRVAPKPKKALRQPKFL